MAAFRKDHHRQKIDRLETAAAAPALLMIGELQNFLYYVNESLGNLWRKMNKRYHVWLWLVFIIKPETMVMEESNLNEMWIKYIIDIYQRYPMEGGILLN